MSNWVKYEDTSIYDGWILEVHVETKEIKWREEKDIVQRLSEEKKKEVESRVLEYFVDPKNVY